MKFLTLRLSGLCLAIIAGAITLFPQTPAPSQATKPQLPPQQQAWEILNAGVQEKSADKRNQAVRALGIIPGDLKVIEIAERALQDEKPEVRAAAAVALGLMGSAPSIPKLKDALSDKDGSVVLAAAHSLWSLKDSSAYEVYYGVLTGERKAGGGLISDGMKTLRDRKKMAEFGFEEGIGYIPFAGMGYSAVKALTKDDASPIRAGAAAILANDPDPLSGQALVKAASDKSWVVRVAALDALAKRGDPQFISNIVPEMSDEKDAVRYNAAAVVIKLDNDAAAAKAAKEKTAKPKQTKKPAKKKK
jgi:HEAT repeat protein